LREKIANINSFDTWCADRLFSLDRKYAKRILNVLGLTQSQTDEEKLKYPGHIDVYHYKIHIG